MKGKDPNDLNKKKYKSVMDDPHYDPPDPCYFDEIRSKNGQMTHANRDAMYKVLFPGVVISAAGGRVVFAKPSSLLLNQQNSSDGQGGEDILASWDDEPINIVGGSAGNHKDTSGGKGLSGVNDDNQDA